MADHSQRAHALLSASGSHRWLACTPSAKLEAQYPDTTSPAALEGTLAHEICEIKGRRKLLKRGEPGYMSKAGAEKELEKWRQDPLYNDEMDAYTSDYVDELDLQALRFAEKPFIQFETRLDLTDWIPEGFGTADCIMVGGDTLTVIDFKYGKGVSVLAEGNTQMQLYALGAWKEFSLLYDIKKIRMVIIQPRLNANADVWEISLDDLLVFGSYAARRAALAYAGEGQYTPSDDVCRFCRANRTRRSIKATGHSTATRPQIIRRW